MPTPVPISNQYVVSIGEILWDVAGNQRHIGGAPFNFAYHCRMLGAKSALISCVSFDELGTDLIDRARDLKVDMGGIQRCDQFPTGVVTSEADLDGSISYVIPTECAWDHIQFTDEGRGLIECASVIYFGTLAQRSPVSQSAILAALSSAPPTATCFLDLNLRPPCYTREILTSSLQIAHIVKMNEHELSEISEMYNLDQSDDIAAQQLMEKFGIATVVVTRGPDGATAWDRQTSASVCGRDVPVADMVGCGDAFGAAFTVNLIAGASLQQALEAANIVGAYVATQVGATPVYSASDLGAPSFTRLEPATLKGPEH